ncbi:hypothetical protein, partial [Rhizobium sp. Rhizsp42]|uniref:hypothetical protein n=1 Tax=Rhizobium sp. Rhizsp42 TaxID=3243034 RepID=UPI0039AF4652
CPSIITRISLIRSLNGRGIFHATSCGVFYPRVRPVNYSQKNWCEFSAFPQAPASGYPLKSLISHFPDAKYIRLCILN